MSESFSVGDRVEVVRVNGQSGCSVRVGDRGIVDEAPSLLGPEYVGVRMDSGQETYSKCAALRKLPPPQDWAKLCNLTDVPREVAHG